MCETVKFCPGDRVRRGPFCQLDSFNNPQFYVVTVNDDGTVFLVSATSTSAVRTLFVAKAKDLVLVQRRAKPAPRCPYCDSEVR